MKHLSLVLLTAFCAAYAAEGIYSLSKKEIGISSLSDSYPNSSDHKKCKSCKKKRSENPVSSSLL